MTCVAGESIIMMVEAEEKVAKQNPGIMTLPPLTRDDFQIQYTTVRIYSIWRCDTVAPSSQTKGAAVKNGAAEGRR